jgi:hypothetical protein
MSIFVVIYDPCKVVLSFTDISSAVILSMVCLASGSGLSVNVVVDVFGCAVFDELKS